VVVVVVPENPHTMGLPLGITKNTKPSCQCHITGRHTYTMPARHGGIQ